MPLLAWTNKFSAIFHYPNFLVWKIKTVLLTMHKISI